MRLLRALSPVVLAAVLLGCGAAPALPSSLPIPVIGDVTQMVSYLLDHAVSCGAPKDAGNGHFSWTCQHDDAVPSGAKAPDRTVYRVTLVAGLTGLTEIDAVVDQSADKKVDQQRVVGFLTDTIGGAAVLGENGRKIAQWVKAHAKSGGTVAFAPINLTMTPVGKVTRLTLAFDR
jgi:hypothetical protein